MKPIPTIVAPALDVATDVAKAHSDLREAEAQEIKAADRHTKASDLVAKRRLDLGRALIKARKAFPARGPKAKGWGELLDREGIAQQRAWELMKLAGYVEEISPSNDHDDGETRVPTLREAGARGSAETQPDPPAQRELLPTPALKPVAGFDLRLGRWEDVLDDVAMVDAVITDPPYSARTHAAAPVHREDGHSTAGVAPTYTCWSEADIEDFVGAWAPRCRGWMVALTDHSLFEFWARAFARHGRYAFAPVPCVIRGMSVRLAGDGPSSWAVYAAVSRPAELSKWGTLPGAYVGGVQPDDTGKGRASKSGRGKPRWLMDELVRDYTRQGDLVVDPLGGYGTTLLAAIGQGRRAIGAEVDADAYAEALRRAGSIREEAA